MLHISRLSPIWYVPQLMLSMKTIYLPVSLKWGSEEKEFNVLVDGKEVPVTANAYKLLRDMSSYLFPRLIWIDSICIDQDVRSEKGEQVSLM